MDLHLDVYDARTAVGGVMKVVLSRGGNYRTERFDASPTPQEVPDAFGRAMIARGLAKAVAEPAKKVAPVKSGATAKTPVRSD